MKIEYNIIDKSSSLFFDPNNYRYISYNDLGLIFITELKDIKQGEDNLKESFYAEYPFGQNNFGLLNEFYLNEIEKAEYMYERSSKHNFSLALFNLGRIQEKNKKPEQSIKYYILASEHEDEPLEYRGITRFDLRLDISKTFIICFTNLILVEHYFSRKEYEESEKYFIRAFKKIIFIAMKNRIKFKLKIEIKDETSGNYSKDVFSYLKKFILNFPAFHLNIQQNLKDKPYSNIFNQDFDKIYQNENESIKKMNLDEKMISKVQNSIEKKNKENKFEVKNVKSSKISFQTNTKDNNFDLKKYLLSNRINYMTSKFHKGEIKTSINSKEYEKEKKHDSKGKEKIFDNPGDLFDFVIHKSDSKSASKAESDTKPESKLKKFFLTKSETSLTS